MAQIVERLRDFLERRHVPYEVIPHGVDHTARQTAWDTHTPANDFAKTVFVRIDDEPAMAVLPADDRVSEEKLRLATSSRSVELLDEEETEALCPDCEIGAAPPFGNLYDLPVYVSLALAADPEITFNGGTHRAAVRLAYDDFCRVVEPEVVPLARHD